MVVRLDSRPGHAGTKPITWQNGGSMSKILIGKYEGTIYPDGDGYRGAIDLEPDGTGKRQRVKRRGRTKEAVKDKLKKVVEELETGIKSGKDADNYTVTEAVNDWLTKGTKSLGQGTVDGYRILADKHLTPLVGAIKVKKLKADDVDDWLDGLTDKLSTRSLQAIHSVLRRAIRQAQVRDKVIRNVADLVDTPKGRAGRPSRALTLEQATAVIEKARKSPLHAYVIVSLMTGIRTEEARALRWDHVVAWVNDPTGWQPVTKKGFDHDKFAIYVWRSVREDGDTKTKKSRRTLELPTEAATALRELHRSQAEQRLKAGSKWQDHGLVFCTRTGTPLAAGNVRRSFRGITRAAGIGENWTPRELRHSFVSIMSDHGVPIEKIADLVGHKSTTVTERVYRHQLKPVIAEGATTMNTIFQPGDQQAARKSA
jgi:integrase